MITDEEFDGFRKAMKEVADKKMRKLSKKLEHWAGIYFGERWRSYTQEKARS